MPDRYENLERAAGRDRQNSFEFWFPKIQSCGIPVPKSFTIPVSPDLVHAFYMDDLEKDLAQITEFVKDTVEPIIKNNHLGLVFIKNAVFSNKFDAGHGCLPYADDLVNAIIHVMQGALEMCGFQYDGTDLLVIRERIGYDMKNTPCIYSGLPFRPEYRVFYDFDLHKPIFVHDYWDKEYVYPHLYTKTDRLIFDGYYDHVRAEYDKNAQTVMNMVSDAMKDINTLTGPWSIDILQDDTGKFWLIDMAVAEMSAYWENRPK